MLKIAIENWYTGKYAWSDEYWARALMQKLFYQQDIELVRVSINTFDTKKNQFSEYNILDIHWKNKTIKKKFIPDIVRSRRWAYNTYKYETLQKFIIVPSEKVSVLANDKFENYKFTEKYQPFTCLLSNLFTSKAIWQQFKNMVVLKPIRANWGKWISLTTTEKLLKLKKKYHWMEELFIVQQFKDFSKWYQWITTSSHDVRLMFAGNKIIEITLRTPKKGDFRSNIWSWGTQITLQKKQLPKELLVLSKHIYKDLRLQDNNIFSMDFAYCAKDKQRYLLEINSSPGTWYYQEDKKILEKICLWLASFFKQLP